MNPTPTRGLTNSQPDIRLVSLASWSKAIHFSPRDRHGPYVLLQEGFHPADPTLPPDEYVLGRSGGWLSLAHFYRLPALERREEFLYGTAAEALQVLAGLTWRVELIRPGEPDRAGTFDDAGREELESLIHPERRIAREVA
jgi:hypothetical protein